MNELSLFSGAGGGLLATQHLLGFRTVCYVEIDGYCQEILKARIRDGLLDDAPIWDDVRTFDGKPWRGCVDLVTAGFPCQPFSVAGQQQAEMDDRNLWPETIRVIREVEPRWCLLENVPGLLSAGHGYFGTVLGDLAEGGCDARWKVLSAAELGAPHLRKRLWIVAHAASRRTTTTKQPGQVRSSEQVRSDVPDALRPVGEPTARGRRIRKGDSELADAASNGRQQGTQVSQGGQPKLAACSEDDANNTDSGRHGTPEEPICPGRDGLVVPSWWAVEPALGRVVNGLAHRVDRLRALGNGQVSAVVARAWELLSQ